MDLRDLSAYLTGLLRSEAEVVTAFVMGAMLAGTLVLWLRHRLLPGRDAGFEFARRDAEIARRDIEIARRDAQIAVVEAKLAILESKLSGRARSCEPSPDGRFASMEASLAELDAENQSLRENRRSAEADTEDLRAKLTQARDEVAHWAKWARVHEENAHLAEIGSLREE